MILLLTPCHDILALYGWLAIGYFTVHRVAVSCFFRHFLKHQSTVYMNPVANSLRASEPPQGPKFFSFLSHSSTRIYFISSVRDVVTLRQSAPSPKYFLIRLFPDGLLSVPPSKPRRCCGGSDYSFISCTRQAGGAGGSSGKDTGCGCQGELSKICQEN